MQHELISKFKVSFLSQNKNCAEESVEHGTGEKRHALINRLSFLVGMYSEKKIKCLKKLIQKILAVDGPAWLHYE